MEGILSEKETVQDEDGKMAQELLEIVLNTREQGQLMEQLIKSQIEVVE